MLARMTEMLYHCYISTVTTHRGLTPEPSPAWRRAPRRSCVRQSPGRARSAGYGVTGSLYFPPSLAATSAAAE